MPLPIVPQLAGLDFWYLPSAGDAPTALLFLARFYHDAEGGTAADYVALTSHCRSSGSWSRRSRWSAIRHGSLWPPG